MPPSPAPADHRPRPWREVGLVALKLVVSGVLLGSGFHGVSDDDFARVVIAQGFAREPQLDPSGTSWLPLPFWITGLAMRLFGGTVGVAVAVAVLLGAASVVLVHRAALALTKRSDAALWSALLVAILPWSARLGASAVPELPTAACSLFAIASLVPGATPRARLAGALLLLAACLSRYEPWFLAAGFALLCLRDAAVRREGRAPHVLAAVVALAAPVAWSAWNAHAHGSPFHYLDRVAAYKQAVDQGAILERATSYLLAVFRAEPELAGALAFVGVIARRELRAALPHLARPLALLAFLLLALTLSSIKGGAPTHHPERALLTLHLFLAVLTALAARLALAADRLRPSAVVAAMLVVGGGAATLRATLLFKESVAQREAELSIGREVAGAVPAGERVLLEVVDYGYFAVLAGSARPWDFVLSDELRPGRLGEPLGEAALLERARARDLGFAVGRGEDGALRVFVVGE